MFGKGQDDFSLERTRRDDIRYKNIDLASPINTVQEKWRLLPCFLQTRGLVQQHIDSFNHFISKDLNTIMSNNNIVYSDVDPKFFLKFTNIRVLYPESYDAQIGVTRALTPHECRLREITYAAFIHVDINYVKGNKVVSKRSIEVGRMPIMLKSNQCVLSNKTPLQISEVGECPLDPGGYFVIKGAEKVILIQEQLSKNRIIIETDRKGFIQASVTSSTHEKKSKTYVGADKYGKITLKHNSLSTDIPIFIALKALGIKSDREIVQLICGDDSYLLSLISPSLEDSSKSDYKTTQQCLEFIGSKIKMSGKSFKVGVKRDALQEAVELLATTVLAHVPVENINGDLNFKPKATYIGVMVRRVLQALQSGGIVDDRDFVGNKRLELY